MVLRSIHTLMKWQPMPAIAREPSGTLVEVLCGQPEQNHGCRSLVAPSVSVCMACSLASSIDKCASICAVVSASMPIFFRRLAMARAMMVGVKSALALSKVRSVGLGTDHSPPDTSPSASSNLPKMLGRTSLRQLYSSSLSWYSMIWRFSSTTKISRKPVANSRVDCASSGHTTATLCKRMPNWRQRLSSSPKSSSAWRVSL